MSENLPAVPEPGEVSASGDGVGEPRDWEKAVQVAYFRLLGFTQKEAAIQGGINERSVRRWESSEWWPDALREADSRWLSEVTSLARRQLRDKLKDGTMDPIRILERLDARLAPNVTHRHVGHDGESIQVEVTRTIVDPGRDED